MNRIPRLISAMLAIACLTLAFVQVRTANHRAAETPGALPVVRAESINEPGLLDRPIADVRLDHVTLEDAINTLADLSRVNICPEWREMAERRMHRGTPVRLHLHDVSLGLALDEILGSVAARDQYLVLVDRGAVIVTTPSGAPAHTITECINVRPLIDEIMRVYPKDGLPTPRTGLRRNDQVTSQGQSSHNPLLDSPPAQDITRTLIEVVTDTVAPGTWRYLGGDIGDIDEMAGIFIVTNLPQHVSAVRQLLARIHQAIRQNDFASAASALPSTGPSGANPAAASIASNTLATEMINLQPLVEELRAKEIAKIERGDKGPAPTPGDIMNSLHQTVTSTVHPATWNTGKGGGQWVSLGYLAIVTQTPTNLHAVRERLEDMYRTAHPLKTMTTRP